MLPDRLSPEFPDALKKAREQRKISLSELAQLAGISSTMTGRYENRSNALFSTPSLDTWRKLNIALFPEESLGLTETHKEVPLSQASIEQLIEQLKAKGAKKLNVEF